MKKIALILLASFYMMVASGLNLSMHYCGGKLKSISFLHNDNEKGCCGNKKKSKGCCKNKTAFIKVKDNHKTNDLLKAPTPTKLVIDIVPPTIVKTYDYVSNVSEIVVNYHAPPVWYDNPIYLKHRVLII